MIKQYHENSSYAQAKDFQEKTPLSEIHIHVHLVNESRLSLKKIKKKTNYLINMLNFKSIVCQLFKIKYKISIKRYENGISEY